MAVDAVSRRKRPVVKVAKPKPPLERDIQKQIVAYLKAAGWSVWQTSQGHKHPSGAKGLRITPGIPDLYAVHPKYGALWVEVKRPGNFPTVEQNGFMGWHVVGLDPPRIGVPRAVWTTSLNGLREWLAANDMTPGAR